MSNLISYPTATQTTPYRLVFVKSEAPRRLVIITMEKTFDRGQELPLKVEKKNIRFCKISR